MVAANKSLRSQIEKLVGPACKDRARVRLIQRSRSGKTRRVCIQVERPTGCLALFFFRHADGTWHVFPPDLMRPAMGIDREAA
ncbi:MAG TPA: hypothetical protein VGM85_14535 [Paraburkholderia sp.]|jgi:hypothetical protein